MAKPTAPPCHRVEKPEKADAILVVGEDGLSAVPASRDVVDASGDLNAR
jgi:hypothetical protein